MLMISNALYNKYVLQNLLRNSKFDVYLKFWAQVLSLPRNSTDEVEMISEASVTDAICLYDYLFFTCYG